MTDPKVYSKVKSALEIFIALSSLLVGRNLSGTEEERQTVLRREIGELAKTFLDSLDQVGLDIVQRKSGDSLDSSQPIS